MLALTDLIALTPVDWVTVGSLVCHRVGKCSYVKRKRQKLEGLPKYIYILIDPQTTHMRDIPNSQAKAKITELTFQFEV